jgi:hypothetical protein
MSAADRQRLAEVLVDELDGDGAFTHGRGDALDRVVADTALSAARTWWSAPNRRLSACSSTTRVSRSPLTTTSAGLAMTHLPALMSLELPG